MVSYGSIRLATSRKIYWNRYLKTWGKFQDSVPLAIRTEMLWYINQNMTIKIKTLLKYIPLRWQSNKKLECRCITNARVICVRCMTAQASRSREVQYSSYSQLEKTWRLEVQFAHFRGDYPYKLKVTGTTFRRKYRE